MNEADRLALEAYPVKYTVETWKRAQPDRNAPLRAAFIRGFHAACRNTLYRDALAAVDPEVREAVFAKMEEIVNQSIITLL